MQYEQQYYQGLRTWKDVERAHSSIMSHSSLYNRPRMAMINHPSPGAPPLSPKGGEGTGGEGVQANRSCKHLTVTPH